MLIYNYSVKFGLMCHIYAYGVKDYGYNNTFCSSSGPTCDKHDTLGDVPQDCMDIINCRNGDNSLGRAGGDESAEHTGRNECNCCKYWYNHNNITCHRYAAPENCTGVHDTSVTNYIADQVYWDGLFKHEVKWCEVQGRIAADVRNCSFLNQANTTIVTAKRWNVYEAQLQVIILNSSSTYVSSNIQWDKYELTSTFLCNYDNIVGCLINIA